MVELDDFKPAFTPAVAAEAIGMFLATFLSSACAANAADNGLAAAALGTGFAFAMITYSTVHISGGHLNPAITAAYMAVGANGFTIREGISYMLAQFTGAIAGAFLIKSILPIEALVHPFVTLGSLSDKHGEQVDAPCGMCQGPRLTHSELLAARGQRVCRVRMRLARGSIAPGLPRAGAAALANCWRAARESALPHAVVCGRLHRHALSSVCSPAACWRACILRARAR